MDGKERIRRAFAQAKHEGRAALIPYVTAGYPRLDVLPELIDALARAGADLIEVGIPFSDPLADGPVLQRASTEALAHGTKLADIFRVVGGLKVTPPLLFLTYVNPVLRYGEARFMAESARQGVSGIIVPDLPWIEAGSLRTAADEAGIALIPLVAPTSTDRHLGAIRRAGGFVYGVSVTGVTGLRRSVGTGVADMVERIKARVALPVAIGFGISSPEHARQVGEYADGVIVGSALMQHVADHPGGEVEAAGTFVRALREALNP